MKYLNKFDTLSDYQESASTLDTPNVCYITATTEVIYNATPAPEPYVVFADQTVGQKCATLYGDGTGCTMSDLGAVSAISASDWKGTSQNKTTYTSFDELEYFTGITSIPNECFNYCPLLTSITIPDSVTSIGNNVFYGCSGLTTVTIGSGVTSIGLQAFYTCKSLTSVTIPSSVTSIGTEILASCPGLSSIVVESGNSVYDSRNNCNAIIETATNKLIQGCKTTIIPNSVTLIGLGAFYGCTDLTSVTIPNSVTSIGQQAFYACKSLTSVTIPSSVTSINKEAFRQCSGLTSVNIGSGVTEISISCFSDCKGLTSITIPSTVTKIKEQGFGSCTSLSAITFEATTPPIREYNAFTNLPTTGNITVPVGSESNFYSLAQTLGNDWTVNEQTPA